MGLETVMMGKNPREWGGDGKIFVGFFLSFFIAYSAGALLCPQCAASRHE